MKVVETHGHHFNNVVDAVGKAVFVVGQVQAVKAYKYRRELEDNEDPFERDHDVEELFGQEYYDVLDERYVTDNGDLFVRDFEVEEFFGREYDLLDEC